MEGLIPFLLHAMKKPKPARHNIYRCLSDNSTTGRSYHVLLAGDSVEGSSHRRTRSDFQLPSSTADSFLSGSEASLAHLKSFSPRAPVAAPPNAGDGLRQRALVSAYQYQDSGRANVHRR